MLTLPPSAAVLSGLVCFFEVVMDAEWMQSTCP
jgi:hypothetical protein